MSYPCDHFEDMGLLNPGHFSLHVGAPNPRSLKSVADYLQGEHIHYEWCFERAGSADETLLQERSKIFSVNPTYLIFSVLYYNQVNLQSVGLPKKTLNEHNDGTRYVNF